MQQLLLFGCCAAGRVEQQTGLHRHVSGARRSLDARWLCRLTLAMRTAWQGAVVAYRLRWRSARGWQA
eukprot:3490434-Lingulodinium_polyedra.AAC.1